MAKTKWATVTGHEDLGGGVHRIHCLADEPLHHVAGNYVILRSTVPNPDKPGEVLKKAYSISSAPDAESPQRFHFTIVDVGAMSAWLASQRVDGRVEFSGPWGRRFRAQPDDPDGPVHLFATGTGFSPVGAMAITRSRSGATPVGVWWQTEHTYDDGVLAALKQDPRFSVTVGAHVADAVPAEPEALYFLAGDGAVIIPLCERLEQAGVPDAHIRTEFFFNKPAKPT
ncbi:MAG: FAD-dependent oxidoreductase [Myxococcota bacterium]|nr:FAD-dependent oxidoreductase [Myxococcota bacterium]MEC8422918.1 FAD-dependent oxidoreductase [Myxococcota bacterium]